ncbi:MAG: AAA family ATPase [Cyclobacteriaceae bacterium]
MTSNQKDNKVILICFYGPESTGKSTLAKKLAVHFQTLFVPEVAREIVTSNQFTLDDIRKIAKAQNQRVKEFIPKANRFLICDTDILTTRIYSNQYLGEAPIELDDLEKEILYDHYFLFDIDVPWISDGMRDLKDQRPAMLEKFKKELDSRAIPYTWVRGNYEERERFLIQEIEKRIR